jgi:hypothetical protein
MVFIMPVFSSSSSFAAADKDVAVYEVELLIESIKMSHCRFNRNGSWYESKEAADHLNTKYQYIHNLGLIESVEDFIRLAASKSSISGEEYIVQCEDGTTQISAEWLTNKLKQIREIL